MPGVLWGYALANTLRLVVLSCLAREAGLSASAVWAPLLKIGSSGLAAGLVAAAAGAMPWLGAAATPRLLVEATVIALGILAAGAALRVGSIAQALAWVAARSWRPARALGETADRPPPAVASGAAGRVRANFLPERAAP
jgi:hypothetical protein